MMKQIEDNYKEIEEIVVTGAKENNLKNISVTIPRDKMTVITGMSGSGKSSLAFDTLFAEGQRRYIETLSAYAKQFLNVLKKPDVDRIEGLSPAISIEQKTLSKHPRSTVGTVTEIYDYLRLLFAKIGVQYSIDANIPVVAKSHEQILNEILNEFDKKRVMILSPVVHGRKGHYKELFLDLQKQGFTKVRVDGEILDLALEIKLARYQIHDIDVIIDRIVVKEDDLVRISQSLDLALKMGDGNAIIHFENPKTNEWDDRLYNINFSCPITGRAYKELAPNKFSFNSPYGACQNCSGMGELYNFDPELIIPNKNLSINEGAIQGLEIKRGNWMYVQLTSFLEGVGVSLDTPVKDLETEIVDIILNGSENYEFDFEYTLSSGRKTKIKQKLRGIIPLYMGQYEVAITSNQKKRYENLMRNVPCPKCNGGRLNEESMFVRIDGRNISEIAKLDIDDCIQFFKVLTPKLSESEKKISGLIIKEIISRLEFLENVGLAYLSLDRTSKTLSGGEAQRIRLASQIGSKLVGIMYVLDEPSIGLHQHDNNRLINSLKHLTDLGNTLIVVEHDKAMIEQSDYLIDIGPGAGVHGGELILATEPKNIKKNKKYKDSITAQYLLNELDIVSPEKRREGNGQFIELLNATGNNLKDVNLKLPLGKLICVTGMSGSGKSTLVNDTLIPILMNRYNNANRSALAYKDITGLENIDKVIEIDQAPIGRTPRSNPATYTGLFTHIRDFFTMLPESKIRGYSAGRFSFNVKDGRCAECEGAGMKKIEMNFLPDVYVKCDECDGKRYNRETLEIKYKGKSISEVLDMTVEEALEFFIDIPKIKTKVKALNDVGLTYITLGQQAPTLSGGEAQRVKLATELAKKSTGKTIYMLDEPTTGLHFHDINILMKLLNKLVDKGNTVIIIEHNLDVIKCADWVVDLGPEGGKKGGLIVAEGTPEDIVKSKKSLTGLYLKSELKNYIKSNKN